MAFNPRRLSGLWLLKMVARCALALTWIYEGLIPKILIQRADEIALVQHAGLYWRIPSHTLAALGFAEIALGLWLLLGHFEKLAAILSTAVRAIGFEIGAMRARR